MFSAEREDVRAFGGAHGGTRRPGGSIRTPEDAILSTNFSHGLILSHAIPTMRATANHIFPECPLTWQILVIQLAATAT